MDVSEMGKKEKQKNKLPIDNIYYYNQYIYDIKIQKKNDKKLKTEKRTQLQLEHNSKKKERYILNYPYCP